MAAKVDGMNCSQVPEMSIYDIALSKVSTFKYLGYWITEDLNDN